MFTFLNGYAVPPRSIGKIESIGEAHETIDLDTFCFVVHGLKACEHHFDTIEAANEERDRFIHWINVVELKNDRKDTLEEAKSSKTTAFWKGETCETCVFSENNRCHKNPPLEFDFPRVYNGSKWLKACSFWEPRGVNNERI